MPVLMFYNCCLLLWCCLAGVVFVVLAVLQMVEVVAGAGGRSNLIDVPVADVAVGQRRWPTKISTPNNLVKLMVVAIVQSWIMLSFCISQNMKILTSQENSTITYCIYIYITSILFSLSLSVDARPDLFTAVEQHPQLKCVYYIYAHKQNTNRFTSIHIESVGSPSDKAAALASSLAWQTPTSPHAKSTAEIGAKCGANHEDRVCLPLILEESARTWVFPKIGVGPQNGWWK